MRPIKNLLEQVDLDQKTEPSGPMSGEKIEKSLTLLLLPHELFFSAILRHSSLLFLSERVQALGYSYL